MNNETILTSLARNAALTEASLIQLLKQLEGFPDTTSKETMLALVKHTLQINTLDKGQLLLNVESAGVEGVGNFHHTYKVPPVIWVLMRDAVNAATVEWATEDVPDEQLNHLREMRRAVLSGNIKACVDAYNQTDQWTRQLISPVVIDWLNDQIEESKS